MREGYIYSVNYKHLEPAPFHLFLTMYAVSI